MSHISVGTVIIRDIECLRLAAHAMGADFLEGKTSYRWFGQYMGDTELPAGMAKEDLGKCAHVIGLRGVNYEIGVVRRGKDYILAYDFFGEQGTHDGRKLLEKFGDKLCKLQQQYNRQCVLKQARSHGFMVQEKRQQDGSIVCKLVHA